MMVVLPVPCCPGRPGHNGDGGIWAEQFGSAISRPTKNPIDGTDGQHECTLDGQRHEARLQKTGTTLHNGNTTLITVDGRIVAGEARQRQQTYYQLFFLCTLSLALSTSSALAAVISVGLN
jgi:hypothetical protein